MRAKRSARGAEGNVGEKRDAVGLAPARERGGVVPKKAPLVLNVVSRARIELLLGAHAVEDHARHGEPAKREGLDGETRVVDAAEPVAHDEHDGQGKLDHQVDQALVLAHGRKDAARPFDQRPAVLRGAAAEFVREDRGAERIARLPCGEMRRAGGLVGPEGKRFGTRRPVAQDVGRGKPFGRAQAPRLHGLDGDGAIAARHERFKQRRRDGGLADLGVGSRDEEAGHGQTPEMQTGHDRPSRRPEAPVVA